MNTESPRFEWNDYMGCPTCYRTRNFFNNSNTNDNIWNEIDTYYRHIPLHFLHNELTTVQITLQYFHLC
jgi:hypothetical protein